MLTFKWEVNYPITVSFKGKCGGTGYFEGPYVFNTRVHDFKKRFDCRVGQSSYELSESETFPLSDCIECLCNLQERVYANDFIFKKV